MDHWIRLALQLPLFLKLNMWDQMGFRGCHLSFQNSLTNMSFSTRKRCQVAGKRSCFLNSHAELKWLFIRIGSVMNEYDYFRSVKAQLILEFVATLSHDV